MLVFTSPELHCKKTSENSFEFVGHRHILRIQDRQINICPQNIKKNI